VDDLTKKEQSTDEVEVQRRIARLERTCLFLGIAVLLLGFCILRLGITTDWLVKEFELTIEHLKLFGDKLDIIHQALQGLI